MYLSVRNKNETKGTSLDATLGGGEKRRGQGNRTGQRGMGATGS